MEIGQINQANGMKNLENKLNYYEGDDGEFFIKYEDYLTYYRTTSITHFDQNYKYQCMQVKQPKSSYNIIEVEFDVKTHLYVYIHQPNPRLMQKAYQHLPPSPSRIIVAKVLKENNEGIREFEFLDGIFSYELSTVWDSKETLLPGRYAFFIEVEWTDDAKVREYTA